MKPTTHTQQCLWRQDDRKQRQDTWRAQWPHHCTHCDANTDCSDPCAHCLINLTCPRCGAQDAMDPEDATIPCEYCGWVEGQEMGLPPDYICSCRIGVQEEIVNRLNQLGWQRDAINQEMSELRRKLQ